MSEKIAQTRVAIHSLLAERWSPRAFSSQAVDEKKISTLIEAARWSPSSYNLQPWRFIVWHQDQNPYFEQVYATLSNTNKAWVRNVPVLIGVFADTRGVEGQVNHAAVYDTGAAALALVLQAQALGLVSHQLGGFDKQALREQFSIPEHITILSLIAIGYQGQVHELREDLQAKELAPRSRQALESIVFNNTWPQEG